jgi:glycerol-3-phosphate dehydrogenase
MAKGDRILFAIPWGERVILGTTDTDYDGPLDRIPVDRDDVDYVLGVVNETFPSACIDRTDIISSWGGLRPLIARGHRGPSDISRAHEIRGPRAGWIDVAGGKLTTYRLIGRQVVDRLVESMGKNCLPSCTEVEPLLPPEEVGPFSGIRPPDVGPEAVEHSCRGEWVVHLDDVMIRRTNWHYYHRNAAEIARQVAGWMGEIFGWDAARRAAELIRYQQAASGGGGRM